MTQNIAALRGHLFDAIEKLKAGELDLDRAKAINEISKTIVDTARVEVDFLEATGGDSSAFLDETQPTGLPPGITGRTIHRIG